MKEYDLDSTLWDILVEFFFNGLYVYSVTIMAAYLILSLASFRSVKLYLHKTKFIDYKDILNSTIAPGISIVAPAYNESATIIENIRSLLSLHYPKFEVIIVNDGSKDETLDLAIQEYNMVKVDYCINNQLTTKEVRGVYKSKDKAFNNLIVVDKANGGKSDALNCGMNVSNYNHVTCIDVDCILEQDALLKLMKPFTDETTHDIIATGGVVRVANSCQVEDGRLISVNVPENFLARTQALEYIRAFLLGRMAWSLLDGLILISGAIGVFKKDLVVECGGYDHTTVGEDMELVVRMRRYMKKNKRPYHVAYVPDPLCWTEVPESWKLLGRQRNRWTRGTIETLLKHKKMFFNPKHGLIGMVSYPYWFFFEWLAPLLEAAGLTILFLFVIFGLVNWGFFFLMLFLVYGFTLCFSVLSLLIEEITYHQYKKHSEVFKLLFVGLIEPVLFHPWVVYSAIMGNFDWLLGKSSWGDMARKGFAYGSRQTPKKISVVQNTIGKSTAAIKKAQIGTKIVGIVGALSIGFVGYFVYKGISEDNFPKPKVINAAAIYTLDEYDDIEQSELVLLKGTEEEAYNPKSKVARAEFEQETELEPSTKEEFVPKAIEAKPLLADNKAIKNKSDKVKLEPKLEPEPKQEPKVSSNPIKKVEPLEVESPKKDLRPKVEINNYVPKNSLTAEETRRKEIENQRKIELAEAKRVEEEKQLADAKKASEKIEEPIIIAEEKNVIPKVVRNKYIPANAIWDTSNNHQLAETKPKEVAPKAESKSKPKVESQPVATSNNTANEFKLVYHLIAGSFSNKDNALKLQDKLKSKGFTSEVLVFSQTKFRVTYGAYQLKDEAYTSREMLQRQGEAKDAWIYKESNE